jgi:hypothetical protein
VTTSTAYHFRSAFSDIGTFVQTEDSRGVPVGAKTIALAALH